MLLLVGLVTVCTAADTGLVHETKYSTTKDSSDLIQALIHRVHALEKKHEELKANSKLQQAEIKALKLGKTEGKKRIEAHNTIAPIAQLVERPLSEREVVRSNPGRTKGVKLVPAAPVLTLA